MKSQLLYEGKAKRVYSTDSPDQVMLEFKNSLTAFNALKKGEFEGKGALNCRLTTLLFKYLSSFGIKTHWISSPTENTMLAYKTRIIPVEVVVRNVVAGSLAKKLGQEEGQPLKSSIVEFYYKSDELQDPFINDDHCLVFGWATSSDLKEIRRQVAIINEKLRVLFDKADINLVDFKVEFGFNSKNEIILADEISPDCMRLWDKKTSNKLDKDRFRRDLGDVDKAYIEVLNRIENALGEM